MKTRVLLVHPEISRTKYNFKGAIENEALEIEYIKSILDKGEYETEIFDRAVENASVESKIGDYMPDVVYVCGRTRQENFMKEYCRAAKSHNQSSITILGGIHAQHNYKRLYDDGVDCILITFDVFKLDAIINAFLKKDYSGLENISGICYQDHKKWHVNKAEPFDIKRLPHPDRSYLYKHLDAYRYLDLFPCAHVRTAYSCVYQCSFCYRRTLNCGKYTCRDVEDVVDEIEKIECENIFIIDDDFLLSPGRIREFIRLIKERGIKKRYVCYGRVDFIIHNKELIEDFAEIGCHYILVGMEAFDDTHLNAYNKSIRGQENMECIEFLNQTSINIMGMFIVDFDYKRSDFKKLYRWIKRHNLRHVAISIFVPEFELDTYEVYKDKLITDNPEHWDYLHLVAKPENLSVFTYYFQYYTLLIKLFLRAKRQGVYDFIDYGYYIKSFIKNIFRKEKG